MKIQYSEAKEKFIFSLSFRILPTQLNPTCQYLKNSLKIAIQFLQFDNKIQKTFQVKNGIDNKGCNQFNFCNRTSKSLPNVDLRKIRIKRDR